MLEEIIKERLKKRDNLIRAGYQSYPAKVPLKNPIGDLLRHFFFLFLMRRVVTVGGRIVGMRVQGGVMFLDLKDESGKMQAVLNKSNLKDFVIMRENLDIGDFIVVQGKLFKTKKGERSIKVAELTVAAKSLRPLPSEWYGLKDVEERYRKRYLDLLLNKEVRKKILGRLRVVKELRRSLENEGFLEVETPILQPIPGGATARPFVTHHNALDENFYLRIAPELYLKRLLVAGFEKIFEIGTSFRNEGVDRDHNPEFMTLELYWAYQDYQGLILKLEKWLKNLWPLFKQGSWRWERKSFSQLFKECVGRNWDEVPQNQLEEMYKREIRAANKIKRTTLVTDYPEIMMPLAKLKKEDQRLTESFQLIAGSEDTGMVGGPELVKGFSEMNDPVIQRKQMERQESEFRAGNEEASRLDEDFLEALEYGMPPAAGLGIGIDRLATLLTNARAVKDVIFFPTLRPKK